MRHRPAVIGLSCAVVLLALHGCKETRSVRSLPASRPTGTVFGWRGDGTGHFAGAELPLTWDGQAGRGILWRADVGAGRSSPVVAGERIILTVEDSGLICLDRRTGRVVWERDNGFHALSDEIGVFVGGTSGHSGNHCGTSTPTPVTDGRCVWASYGTGVVVCYDLDGRRRWARYIDRTQRVEHGRSASQVLVGGRLLVTVGGLVALDATTGKTLWQADQAHPSYGSPVVARVGGRALVVTANGDCIRPGDGKILASDMAECEFSSPVIGANVAYFMGATAVAVELTPTERGVRARRLWENRDLQGEFFGSPVLHGHRLYGVNSDGVLYILNAATGETVCRQEIEIPPPCDPDAEPPAFYPSATLGGRHLLVGDDNGDWFVFVPADTCKLVGRGYLDGGSCASPVPDGKDLLLRAGNWLVCVGAAQ